MNGIVKSTNLKNIQGRPHELVQTFEVTLYLHATDPRLLLLTVALLVT